MHFSLRLPQPPPPPYKLFSFLKLLLAACCFIAHFPAKDLRSLLVDNEGEGGGGGGAFKFFIYEWPKEYGDVYPDAASPLVADSPYNHGFRSNSGAGDLLDPSLGLFQTWQFSLYANVMSRLLVSRHRTRNASLATSFIIPFDAGVHSYVDKLTGKYRLATPYGWNVIRWLQEAQSSTGAAGFWRHYGHDHFVLFSLTVFVQTGIGVKEFFKGVCQNCSVLAIETTPTRTSTLYHRSRKYWYAVPYPSSYHWYEGIPELPWSVSHQSRDILCLFIGSVQTKNIAANAVRRALRTQCNNTRHPSYNSNNNNNTCIWHSTSHSCNGVVDAVEPMRLFKRAKFCLTPPGDTVTRKSLFDALVAGCIPVIFAKATISQYVWFFSEQEIEDVAVYIPVSSVMTGQMDVMLFLSAMSDRDVRRKQLAIERIAPRLQYSVVPRRISQHINISAAAGESSTYSMDPTVVWEPPLVDAVDILIERMLDPRTVEPRGGFTVDQRRAHKCLQNDLISYHPDYGGLFKSGTVTLAAGKLWRNIKCLIPNPNSPFLNSSVPVNAIVDGILA